ncbi:T6SS phospholipase effector Tle1-like catalytic domain-containing protein [Klebsiella aerogenes]|uniref:T6SS phospholipase effector Tle1-like catalytic domain-containing protein n=1 Tax=Klebsiella aerogenes TaxID=548 RepID=UPI0013646075|nr:DUF2235 domain-containing protein [Klebsiella aerogenes]QHJ51537.1 DUF2235 domain-containing protein [Klebsiella aerogenes]HDH0707598.1 DUF2235 domain-containing protein [Klebsiella aerogenes]
MSDTAESTLNALKALIAAFQTGATPVAVKTSTAEAASLPPKFPGPDDKNGEKSADNSVQQKAEYNERGRLPASRTQTEGNYARQYLEGYVGESDHQLDKKTEPGCPASLHISLFFDGTCCNEEDGDEVYGSRNPPLTNIGRLYHAASWVDQKNTAENDGYFSYYFPGCGARFPQIGEEHYSLDGELFANGGEDRINQALLKTYSSICYAVNKTAIKDSELTRYRNSMATVWPFSRLTQKFNRKSALDKFCDDHLGAVVNQWPRQPTRLHIQRSQRRIAKIKLFVYGYCRGAATARAFARGLESLLDDAKMPLDATNMLPAGTVVPAGPTLLGIPISIEFMGLLDTVSAVGVPHILPSATGHLGWAANSLRLPTTKGFLKSCYHFVAGHEQHGDLPLDSIRGPDGKYPSGAVEVVYPGMHADVGGDCKPTELGKVQTDARSLLSKIVLHDMYAAAFDAGAPLSVPEEVLPGGAKGKKYRVMQGDVADQFKISAQAIALFNAWQQAGAQQAGAKSETPAVNEAEVVAIAVAQGRDPVAALKAAHDKADGDKAKAAAAAKPPENGPLGKLPDPVYVPLKAKALEVMLADQLSWITAWRTERFASPQYADKYYQRKPFYQQALNESSGALPSEAAPAESEGPREVPFIDKDRLDRAAWGYDFAHTGIVALLAQVLLDVIPTTQTNQLGGPLVAAQESEYIQIKKSGDARRAALMGSPTMLDFYDNYVHDTLAKYNHDPLHSSFSHGYFASRTIYDNDDDTWDSVKQFGQRVKAIIDINVGDILVQARTDMKDLNTVSGVLGKIYRDIKSEAFKILLP